MASPSSSPSEKKEPQFQPILKKTQPLPWSHQETINLIQSYQEKWYSLKKGQLKSSQWEQVCVTVAARCGYDDEPSKSATQCRHKIEKLRKRYRSEKLKPYPDSWPYFHLMDSLESGPPPPLSNDHTTDNDSAGDLDFNKSRSINHILKGGATNNTATATAFRVNGKRKEFFDDDDEEEEVDNEQDQGTCGLVTELAVQIKTFAHNFLKVEHTKIQMMRETAKYQMEMENKRIKMIIESQHKILDTIHQAFTTSMAP